MHPLKRAVIAVLIISSIVFIALFGRLPALRNTPIGYLHRLIRHKLPESLRRIDVFLTGGRLWPFIHGIGDYLSNENHPVVLIFYLIVLLASQIMFIPPAFPYLTSAQQVLAICLSILPYYFTYKTVFSTSSIITAANHAQEMRRYPYDHALFEPGHVCRTCHFLKPARSKHCSICNACVAKQDHHCIWVMNCIGKDNAKYFMGLMASLGTLLSYGAYLGSVVLDKALQQDFAAHLGVNVASQHWSDGQDWKEYFQSWGWSFQLKYRVGSVSMLALLTSPLACALFFYHVYLIWAGMTTNETSKWADWREDIADGIVYKVDRSRTSGHEESREEDIEPTVSWPVTSNQKLVLYEDTKSVANALNGREEIPGPGHDFRKVESLAEVHNLYDLGFWDNLKDTIF